MEEQGAKPESKTEGQDEYDVDANDFDYDVCLSFAGEKRKYVEEVANELRSRGVRVFFDDYEKPDLWGKDLYSHLDDIYRHVCRYCILFASKEYADKVWPNHERRSAQARALKAKGEYILPARFDDTPIPGLPDTVHYIDLNGLPPADLAVLVVKKLGNSLRRNYLPPVLDRLYASLDIDNDRKAMGATNRQAHHFLRALRRMTPEERNVVMALMRFGCPVELPSNIHINVDLLRRITGKSVPKLKRLLGGVKSLGFECSMRESEDEESNADGVVLGDSQYFELNWSSLTDDDDDYSALMVACEMVAVATEDRCEECGTELLDRLDFSQLANATASSEPHGCEEELADILDYLNKARVRCTYGAIAEVLDRPARSVDRRLLGRPRPRTSWVVRKRDGEPTGHRSQEKHRELYQVDYIIQNGRELLECMRTAVVDFPSTSDLRR